MRPSTWSDRSATNVFAAALVLALAGCAHNPSIANVNDIPRPLGRHLQVVDSTDAEYEVADVSDALGTEGTGGITAAVVVRLKQDLPVYRLWSGPDVKDPAGRTNRVGQWWTFDAPTGTQQQYRRRYEVCTSWNTLGYVVQCTLRRGAIVAVGPGNSVSPSTCGNAAEAYPPNPHDWQVFIHEAWNRTGGNSPELSCPPDSADKRVDPADLHRSH